jgi:hypothetical protein
MKPRRRSSSRMARQSTPPKPWITSRPSEIKSEIDRSAALCPGAGTLARSPPL